MVPLIVGPLPVEHVLPSGWDAFRIENWPVLRPLMRTTMPSTYDRSGGNEGADASHFLYQEREDFNVTTHLMGEGWLAFARFNRWHGSPWHFELDGKDNVLTESDLRPPLGVNWKTSKGADIIWQPMPFNESLRIAYSKTHYGTGYYIVQRVFPGARLSSPQPWGTPPQFVTNMFEKAGTDQSPPDCLEMRGSGSLTYKGAGTIRCLELEIPSSAAARMRAETIEIEFDGWQTVSAPVPIFFGAGTLVNRNKRRFLVRSIPMNIEFVGDKIVMRCQFPMPFYHSLSISAPGRLKVRYVKDVATPGTVGYFGALYRDHGKSSEPATLYNVTDLTGHLVGTSIIFTHNANLATLEGDPRIYFDGSITPQAHGTGTEEWGGGGDYWSGMQSTLPLCGHPVGAPNAQEATSEEDKIHSLYRFLLPDFMPFMRSCEFELERGANEHYESVVYWYGLPGASLSLAWESGNSFGLRKGHIGVMLVRTFDYESPNQTARVFVDGEFAGVWFSAGSTLGYYSNPPGENDASKPVMQRAKRRVRQDEFLLPVHLTRGKDKITVRLEPVESTLPFLPGSPSRNSASFSTLTLDAECIMPPRLRLPL